MLVIIMYAFCKYISLVPVLVLCLVINNHKVYEHIQALVIYTNICLFRKKHFGLIL
jgi:hypothetical protein